MKYIIDLKGLESASIQVGGSVVEVIDGQEVSEVVYKAAPKFVKVVGSKVKAEPKEEILVEVSEPVEAVVEIEETIEVSKPSKRAKLKKSND